MKSDQFRWHDGIYTNPQKISKACSYNGQWILAQTSLRHSNMGWQGLKSTTVTQHLPWKPLAFVVMPLEFFATYGQEWPALFHLVLPPFKVFSY